MSRLAEIAIYVMATWVGMCACYVIGVVWPLIAAGK